MTTQTVTERAVARVEGAARRPALVFDLFLDETPLFAKVAERLQRDGAVRTVGVTLGRRYARDLVGTTFPSHNISAFCRTVWDRITPEVVAHYEATYGEPSLARFLVADRHLANYLWYAPRASGDHGVKFLVACLMFFEDLVRKERLGAADAMMTLGATFAPHFAMYLVAKRFGIAFFNLFISRGRLDQFVISDTLTDRSTGLEQRFAALLRRELSEAERREATEVLDAFRRTRARPEYMKNPSQHRTLQMRLVRLFGARLARWYLEGWRGDPFDFLTLHPVRYVARDLFGIVEAKRLRLLSPFERPRDGERFVLFPLHLEPEATTLVFAPYWDNQVALVENVAKVLPLDRKLYVKEHYSAIGRRRPGFYDRIRRLPNVRLITPHADSHDLIQRADAVVTITSTVGWEALLYECPVLTFGEVFYNASGLNTAVRTVEELGWALRRLPDGHRPDRERLLRFIAAVRAGFLEGNIMLPHVRPESLEPANVERLAASLQRALVVR
jgi:hypothetical protein